MSDEEKRDGHVAGGIFDPDPNDVLRWLKRNPDFIVRHSMELGVRYTDDKLFKIHEIQLANNKELARRFNELYNHLVMLGERNLRIVRNLFGLAAALSSSRTLGELEDAMGRELKSRFNIKDWTYRIAPNVAEGNPKVDENLVMEEVQAAKLGDESFGGAWLGVTLPDPAMLEWFESEEEPGSFMVLPMRVKGIFVGALAIGHPDVNHYRRGLATENTEAMAFVFGGVLNRILELVPDKGEDDDEEAEGADGIFHGDFDSGLRGALEAFQKELEEEGFIAMEEDEAEESGKKGA